MNGPSRRIIPPGYRVFELRMDGDSPLLMNSSEFDRQGDTYRAFRQLGAKRGKTYEDELRLSELEFHLGLHYDAEIGVFVPGINVKEMLRQAATKWRKGEEIRRSLIVPDYRVPLVYEGPRDPAGLWTEGFYDVRMVANAGAGSGRVPRTRPMFEHWAVVTEVAIDPEDLNDDLLADAVDRAVKYGFGDGRSIGFGAFRPVLTFVRVQREGSSADAAKPRNRAGELAHKSRVRRVMANGD
jgi:hypothetical protein